MNDPNPMPAYAMPCPSKKIACPGPPLTTQAPEERTHLADPVEVPQVEQACGTWRRGRRLQGGTDIVRAAVATANAAIVLRTPVRQLTPPTRVGGLSEVAPASEIGQASMETSNL